jgi:hypothetical protein
MARNQLLLSGIIFTLVKFDFVNAGLESQVFSDLINLHFNENMEWKNCPIVTLDVKQEMAQEMVSCFGLSKKTSFILFVFLLWYFLLTMNGLFPFQLKIYQ